MDSERVRELEQRISDLEAQLSGGWTRRDALKLVGAGGVGALLGGGGAASAVEQGRAGTAQSGQLGAVGSPLDLVTEDVMDQSGNVVASANAGALEGTDLRYESVTAESISSIAVADPGDDLQAKLDGFNKRAGKLLLTHHGGYSFALSSPLLVGDNTVIEGISGDTTDQPESDSSWDFSPTVLDFSGSVQHGVRSDPNAAYRVHHPQVRHVAVVGSGDGNAKTGVDLPDNANLDKTGFVELENVFIEDFSTGADGHGTADGFRAEKCHVKNVTDGFVNMGTEVWVLDSTFWHFTSGGSAINVGGDRGIIAFNEFEMGGGTGASSSVKGVVLDGNEAVVAHNHFKTPYSTGVEVNGNSSRIISNNFGGSATRGVSIMGGGGSAVVSGNVFTGTFSETPIFHTGNNGAITNNNLVQVTDDATVDLITLQNPYTIAAFNKTGSGFNADYHLESGANNCAIWAGSLPNGVIIDSGAADSHIVAPGATWSDITDNGTRTTLNGVGLNAGDPRSTGDWNGNGYEGVVVRDTTNNRSYAYNNGSFVRLDSPTSVVIAEADATVSINAGSYTSPSYGIEVKDTNGEFDNVADTFTPDTTGVYWVGFTQEVAVNTSDDRYQAQIWNTTDSTNTHFWPISVVRTSLSGDSIDYGPTLVELTAGKAYKIQLKNVDNSDTLNDDGRLSIIGPV